MAVAVFDKWASLYEQKYMNVDLYAESLDLFCDQLPENPKVLELACGPGNITRYLLDRRTDLRILATDLAPNMIALAKANNPEAHFKIMDCREINRFDQAFDAVMCGFCLPYLSKEEAIDLIREAASILKANGILYISTMEDDYHRSGWETGSTGDQVFMHYHEHDYLTHTIAQSGLQVIHLERIQYPEKKGTVTDLILVCKK